MAITPKILTFLLNFAGILAVSKNPAYIHIIHTYASIHTCMQTYIHAYK